jgi:GTP:adenosylcobinamide-phosphate guanylyltransferase
LNNFENLDVLYIEDINEIKKFDSDLLSFININTEEDFEYAKRITEEFGI